ncbi:hypothetical protein [Azohydromonas caseinilytica]|uniref:Uncharacterized protein n=1 Tax=Azohydromonas caseinilytica TaxID=2728836 RepID=A0A848FCG4_9BURK|nr:hypothetical protein [Azohydromonas caseinilytica]NML17907.1 hypothetical protein [Azohydromonas caseinilytica]
MAAPELPTGRIALAGAALAGTVIGVVVLVLLGLHGRNMPPGGQRLAQPYTLSIPGPRLQSAPQPDLAAYLAEKEARLHGRGWVNAGAGIVHIPIEDAMALMAAPAASAAGRAP